MSFVFYDTETSDTDTTYGQIFQFAAVLADDELRETDSFSLRCRRLPHIVPSPGALLVTGIRPHELEEANLSHFEMMRVVRQRLDAWRRATGSGLTFIGYNSMHFDEPMLRQAFFQTLLDIYHTVLDGNSRADALRIAQVCSVYAPNCLDIPLDQRNRPVFKLGAIAQANGIVLDNAHEALADTRATLALCRLIRDRAPNVWQRMLGNATKRGVESALERYLVLCLTEHYFNTPYTFVVTEAARNPNDGADIALFDLSFDPVGFLDLTPDELLPWLNGRSKAFRCVRSNAQPGLMPIAMVPEDSVRGGLLNPATYEARANLVRNHAGFQRSVGAALSRRWEDREEPPVLGLEARIHDGFFGAPDKQLMATFHGCTTWSERAALCSQFSDERAREMALRLVHQAQPGLLPPADRARLDAFVANRLTTEDDVPWMTIPKALRELGDLQRTAQGESAVLLAEIEDYLHRLARQYATA